MNAEHVARQCFAQVADRDARITNALSIDVEDYFQVSAFEASINRASWDSLPCRVERNVDR
ncbi:MAG: hypothetical protein ACXWUM_08085, partial [Burkholderiaceae bacterium]